MAFLKIEHIVLTSNLDRRHNKKISYFCCCLGLLLEQQLMVVAYVEQILVHLYRTEVGLQHLVMTEKYIQGQQVATALLI